MTDITDTGLGEIKELKNLQTLDLTRTLITSAGLKELKGLKDLRLLRLSAKVTTDTVHLDQTEDEAGQYATFTFKITHAVEAAMKGNKSLKQLDIAFVPRGGVAKGRFEERKPTATIHISRAEIGLESLE